MHKLEKIKFKCWKIFFKNENYKNKNNIINIINNNYNKNNNITKFDMKNLIWKFKMSKFLKKKNKQLILN